MKRQYLLFLLLSYWVVLPIHAEESTYDPDIAEILHAEELAEQEANKENTSSALPENGSILGNPSGSIIKVDIEKNEIPEGGLNGTHNNVNPPNSDIKFNQVDDEVLTEENMPDSTGENIDAESIPENHELADTATTSNASSVTNDPATATSHVTAGGTSSTTNNPATATTSNSTTNEPATTTSHATTNSSSSADVATPNAVTDTVTDTTINTPINTPIDTPINIPAIPTPPVASINQDFADHRIDTRPQTAVIIELKRDEDDDERFFYLYSDITKQAGYRIKTGNGMVVDNGDGTVTYTANPGFNGTDTFFYGYDAWDYGQGGYGRGSSYSSYGYSWQDYGHWNYGKAWNANLSNQYISDSSGYYSKRKRKAKVRVSSQLGSPIGPTICQIYAVHDEGASDSQFVKFKVIDLEGNRTVSAKIGPEYPGFDIEAIGIHPITAMLYAASENLLYLVHPSEATLKVVGEMDHDEITGFAFHPKDATLFASTDTNEKGKEKGILQIDPDTGTSKMILPSDYAIEALAWNVDGTILYAAEKVKRRNKDGFVVKGSNLIAWYYDGVRLLGRNAVEDAADDTIENATQIRSTRSNIRSDNELDSADETDETEEAAILPDDGGEFLRLGLNVIGSMKTGRDIEINAEMGEGGNSPFTVCEGFGEISGEVESLETRADGMLLFSVDQGRGNKIYAFDPKTCSVAEENSFATPYSDIEGIAWPIHCQSSAVPVPKGWDISFIGHGGNFCIEEGKPFEIKGKVDFASKGFLNLKTSWEIVTPDNAICPKISEETGLADTGHLTSCPKKRLEDSQMLTGDSEFSITAWWPGLTDSRGNYFETVEVRFTAKLYDMLGVPMADHIGNTINGSSIASRSVIATAEACKPPELTPEQLLSEFFATDYATNELNLDDGTLTVVIEGKTYSGELTDKMLTAIKKTAPSSSFQDENGDGIDDLVLVYADGTQQILFAQNDVVEEEVIEPESEEITDSESEGNDESEATTEESVGEVVEAIENAEAEEVSEVDFSEYFAKFDAYLQEILAQDDYDFGKDGLLSVILNDIVHSGKLSKQPIDKVEPFEGNILFGELTKDAQDLPYFPVTFNDGQVFALYYLSADEKESSDETALDNEESSDETALDNEESNDETALDDEESNDETALDNEESNDETALDDEESNNETALDDEESNNETALDDEESNDETTLDDEESNDETANTASSGESNDV